MSRQVQYSEQYNDDNDDDWRPMDYSDDSRAAQQVYDDDPPPPDVLDDHAHSTDAQMDVNTMPDIVEPPPPEEKKPRGKKAAKEKQAIEPSPVKQSKDNIDINAAYDQYIQKEYKPAAASAASKKQAAIVAPKATSSKKSKQPTGVEDVERHQALLMQIDRYRMSDNFKDRIKDSGLRMNGIDDHSIKELENLLTRIRTVVGSRAGGGGTMLGTMVLGGTAVVENLPITNRYANIRGLSAMLGEDPEFSDLVEQLSIDYSIMSVLSPEKRLALLMVRSGMRTNQINQMKDAFQGAAAKSQATSAVVNAPPIVGANASLPSVVVASEPLRDIMREY